VGRSLENANLLEVPDWIDHRLVMGINLSLFCNLLFCNYFIAMFAFLCMCVLLWVWLLCFNKW